MRGGNKVHARGDVHIARALCGANSEYGLKFGDKDTYGDGGPDLPIDCKNCLKLIDEENARLRAGVK